jgi:alpha,alpha-trehalase
MRDHTELIALFKAVQTGNIFSDSKTFCDCKPKKSLQAIEADYLNSHAQSGFDLKEFVFSNFELPEKIASSVVADTGASVEAHIQKLWPVLLRQPDQAGQGTLLSLPYEYIVPGGRFGEIYYWDSYFTMLGLKEAGKTALIEQMVKNFAHLINTVGYIPNGNRTYYIGRSQPPFFALMVQLLAEIKGPSILVNYLPALQKEYDYWMQADLKLPLAEGGYLNRYWDAHVTPRPEAYKEDMELAHLSKEDPAITYKHIRAAAASGWDFSTRWFKDPSSFATIHTTDIIPVDLNALMYLFESVLEMAYVEAKQFNQAQLFATAKENRKKLVLQYCWDPNLKTFCDYDATSKQIKNTISLAMMFPLYAKMVSQEQANEVVSVLEQKLLFDGGVVTTVHTSGQQWDHPNGWAPLQWITVQGLLNYGFTALANTIIKRWLDLNRKVFARTGKMMEKYNVVDTALEAGGGEYEGQDGFGWTNGVFLAMAALEKSIN